jgi:hypothetical protein
LRNTSVSGSAKFPGWESWKTLVSVTAYHSFAGEVEALNTPHDTPPYPFMPSPTSAHSSSHQRNTENSQTNAAAYEIRADGGHTAFRFSATTPKANRSDVKDQIRNSGTHDCRRAKNR